jgi:hypothetical protein
VKAAEATTARRPATPMLASCWAPSILPPEPLPEPEPVVPVEPGGAAVCALSAASSAASLAAVWFVAVLRRTCGERMSDGLWRDATD